MSAFPLEKAEAVPKRIAAKRSGSMLWVLEYLLASGTKRLDTLKGSVEVFHMEVEVQRRPMTLELTAIIGDG